jgi:hypothetical protein
LLKFLRFLICRRFGGKVQNELKFMQYVVASGDTLG